jgi:hypothetical protein
MMEKIKAKLSALDTKTKIAVAIVIVVVLIGAFG